MKTLKAEKKADKIAVLTFDVFGFSRGAAAARNFVYEIGKAKYKSQFTHRRKRSCFSNHLFR